jgi:oxygen-independent coproporphyrinogen-3 oxidase
MLNTLRLTAGLPLHYFEERTGLEIALIAPVLEKARKKGLLEKDPTILKPTELGHRFLNDLTGLFLP